MNQPLSRLTAKSKSGITPRWRFRTLISGALATWCVTFGSGTTYGADSWFSKVESNSAQSSIAGASLDSSTSVFNIVVSLYNDPAGDEDPDVDAAGEEQTRYEAVFEQFADSICEQSNGAHKLGKVRIFRNGQQSSVADIIWSDSDHPSAHVAGFGNTGRHIFFGDLFTNGSCSGSGAARTCTDYDLLADPEGAGNTLGHEWGHYVYGLYDEYVGSNPSETRDTFPQTTDVGTDPSIMNTQWNARGGNYSWLNHSTSDNIGDLDDTAQGRVYGLSGWDVLIQETTDDPRNGNASVQPTRTRYSGLVGQEPTASDSWVKVELPAARCQSDLDIIWMQDDLELQLVIDRSGSMIGQAIDNARTAASRVVDVAEAGATAIGVVTFGNSATELQPIIEIPDPGITEKDTIKGAINTISASGQTAMYDGAALALTGLQNYATTNSTDAGQVVFLLSDGGDNNSTTNESSVISNYQTADVPLITFGYGSFAPTGTLQNMADQTGGRFFANPTSIQDITEAFLVASTSVSSSVSSASSAQLITGGATNQFPFVIDSTLDEATIVVAYVGAESDASISLVDPNGADLGDVFVCAQSGGGTTCQATIDANAINTSGVGSYIVTFENISTGDLSVGVNVIGTPMAVRSYDVRVSRLGGDSVVNYPEPVKLQAAVSKGYPITGVNLVATVTDPSGNETTINLNDNGTDGDATAGDGIYSAIIGYAENGSHTVRVNVDNGAGNAAFTTEGLLPAHAINKGTMAAPATDGGSPGPRTLPGITENFSRAGVFQFDVQGLVADDSSDDPATPALCSPISADNSDNAGAISAAGDVDCFLISGIDTTRNLNVRVTDFAFGMDPQLVVYDALGTTVVSTAVVSAGTDYALVEIASSDIDPSGEMVATVSHTDGAATTGNYNISAGNVITSDGGGGDDNDGGTGDVEIAINAGTFTGADQALEINYTLKNISAAELINLTLDHSLGSDPVCVVGSLSPTFEAICTAVYQTTEADVAAGGIDVTATALGVTASTTISLGAGGSDLAIAVTASPMTYSAAGDIIALEYTVTNNATDEQSNLMVDSYLLGSTVCNGVSLSPTFSVVCTQVYTVTAADISAGSITEMATASSDTEPDVTENIIILLDASTPDIQLTADAVSAGYDAAGEYLEFMFTIENNSADPITNLQVTESIGGSEVCVVGLLSPGISAECTWIYKTTLADEAEPGVTVDVTATYDGATSDLMDDAVVPNTNLPITVN